MTAPHQPEQGQTPAAGSVSAPPTAESAAATPTAGPVSAAASAPGATAATPEPTATAAPVLGRLPAPAAALTIRGGAATSPTVDGTTGRLIAATSSTSMMMTPGHTDTQGTTRLMAAAAAAGAAVAEPAAQATAAPELAQPTGGTVYNGGQPDAAPEDGRPGRPLDPLRLEYHRTPVAALDQISVPRATTGLLLGSDTTENTVVLQLFRPEVTRMALVGGLWPTRLMVFRSLALGARVVVFTTRPAAWDGFGRMATGRDDRLAVLSAERPVIVAASPASPALHVYDLGPNGPSSPPALGPWNAQLTVLPTLTAFGFNAIQAAHATLLRRLSPTEAAAAVGVLGLTGQAPTLVQQVRDDMMTLVGPGTVRYTYLRPTGVETKLFGASERAEPAKPASISS